MVLTDPVSQSGLSDAVFSGVTNVISLVGDVFTAITGNPVLTVFLAASLVTVAVSVFAALKSAAR